MAYFIGVDYGMYGNGESCGAAFRHILSIMPNGSSLYLPAGLYADFLDVEIVNRHDLTFYGDGHATGGRNGLSSWATLRRRVSAAMRRCRHRRPRAR